MIVSFELNHSVYEIEEAKEDLDQLYEHMVYSGGAVEGDLRGLDVAIDILAKVSRQLSRVDTIYEGLYGKEADERL